MLIFVNALYRSSSSLLRSQVSLHLGVPCNLVGGTLLRLTGRCIIGFNLNCGTAISRLWNRNQQTGNVVGLVRSGRHLRSTTRDTLNCLKKFSWILPFCSNPYAFSPPTPPPPPRLSISVKRHSAAISMDPYLSIPAKRHIAAILMATYLSISVKRQSLWPPISQSL